MLQLEVLRLGTIAPKKIRVLDCSSEMLSALLDRYAQCYNRQIGIQQVYTGILLQLLGSGSLDGGWVQGNGKKLSWSLLGLQ